MQHQKQDVLALAKRKQMRPQRHLARKIKSSLRRSRQRPRKLPFAHRADQKPKARRSPCQNLLPRYPKPLGEDRAQAFVALDNIPKRSFQRPHIQLASKPNRQWDRVAPASSFQPLQKHKPALPIRQPQLRRASCRNSNRVPTFSPPIPPAKTSRPPTPSPSGKIVRRLSWRSTTSPSAASSAPTSSSPRSRTASGIV